jgi:hypothetical protein
MKRWTFLACALVAVLAISGAAPGAGGKSSKVVLDMYRATVSAKQYRDLRAKGMEIAAQTSPPREPSARRFASISS